MDVVVAYLKREIEIKLGNLMDTFTLTCSYVPYEVVFLSGHKYNTHYLHLGGGGAARKTIAKSLFFI